MQPVNSTRQGAEATQPSPRARRTWPWWSVASLLLLAVIMLAGSVVSFALATKKPAAAQWPTAVLITVTPRPGPTYIVVTSAPGQALSTPATWAGVTRAVRVNGTQGLSLRIRSAPGAQSDTIKLVPDGTKLLITGDGKQVEDAFWWPVRDPSDNKEGWAVSTYLVPDTGP